VTDQLEMTPLPRGRHGLSREQVEQSQRLRLVRAMADVMAEKGYARTSVADVLRRARVSRGTFYELFASKEDCFMSVFEEAYGHILDAISAGARPAPAQRLSLVLEQYLAAIASDPAAARVFLIEVFAAGDAVLERRLALQRGLVDALAAVVGASEDDELFAVEAFVAATVSLVTARVSTGDATGVRELHQPLLGLAARLGIVARSRAGEVRVSA
jgi:AcrR family transcriptional regulator